MMSLDYDLTRMKDRGVNFPAEPNGDLNHKVHTLIFATIPLGMHQITAKNVDEFWHRMDLWQKAIGPQFHKWIENPMGEAAYPPGTPASEMGRWEPVLITKQDVEQAVGLHTNASSKTRLQFLKDLFWTHERFQ